LIDSPEALGCVCVEEASFTRIVQESGPLH